MAERLGEAYLELTARNNKLVSGLAEAHRTSEKTVNSMQERWVRFGKRAFVAAIAGLTALTAAMIKATKAAAAEELQTTQLRHQLQRLGADNEESVRRVEELAASMQKFTRFGDTQTRSTLQTLMTLSNDYEGSMKNLSLVFDVAESGMFDLNTAARFVGQAMTGNVEILGRYIPELKSTNNEQLKTMTSSEKAAYALKLLNEKFGGLAKTVGDTTAGAYAKLNNAISDLWEALGEGFLEQTNKNLLDVTDSLKRAEPEVRSLGKALATLAGYAVEFGAGIISMFDNFGEGLRRLLRPAEQAAIELAKLAEIDQENQRKAIELQLERQKAEEKINKQLAADSKKAEEEFKEHMQRKANAIEEYSARRLRALGFENAAALQEMKMQHMKEIEEFKGSREQLKELEKTHLIEMSALRKRLSEDEADKARKRFIESARRQNEKAAKRIAELEWKQYKDSFRENFLQPTIDWGQLWQDIEKRRRDEIEKTNELLRQPQWLSAEQLWRRAVSITKAAEPVRRPEPDKTFFGFHEKYIEDQVKTEKLQLRQLEEINRKMVEPVPRLQ